MIALTHLLPLSVTTAVSPPLGRGEPAVEDLGDELAVLVVDEEERAALGRRQLARLGHDLTQQHRYVVCVKGERDIP